MESAPTRPNTTEEGEEGEKGSKPGLELFRKGGGKNPASINTGGSELSACTTTGGRGGEKK